MSYSAKQYFDYEERRMEPSIIVTGTRRRYTETAMAAKNRWLSELTTEQRAQLEREYEEETNKNQYRL